MSRLGAANEQLATMAEEASEREGNHRRLSGRLLTLRDEETTAVLARLKTS